MKSFKLSKKVIFLILVFWGLFSIGLGILIITTKASSDSFDQRDDLIKVITTTPLEQSELSQRNIEFYLNGKTFDTNLSDFGLEIETNATKTNIQFAKMFNKSIEYAMFFDEDVNAQFRAKLIERFDTEIPPTIKIDEGEWDYSPGITSLNINDKELLNLVLAELDLNSSESIRVNLQSAAYFASSSPSQEKVFQFQQNLLKPISFVHDKEKFELNAEDINKVIEPSITEDNLSIGVNRIRLQNLLKEKLYKLEKHETVHLDSIAKDNTDSMPDYEILTTEVSNILKNRASNLNDESVVNVNLIYPPATKGELFDRYIEVDLSQQKLYIWDHNKLFLEESTSTGAEERTPVGKFSIINKAELAWSDTAQKWMPHWMAFYYKTFPSGLKAWLGFHAVTWWYDDNGKQVFEPDTNVGTPLSGGCIKLAREPQKKFFDWAEVGDIAIIHE